jgi:hypothetical protein
MKYMTQMRNGVKELLELSQPDGTWSIKLATSNVGCTLMPAVDEFVRLATVGAAVEEARKLKAKMQKG